MYTRISRSGGRAYLQIVEGYRTDDGKVRQRLIANLCRVDTLKPGDLDALIRGLQRAAGKPAAPAPTSAAGAEFEPARAFGHLYLLHQLWQQLGLGSALRRCFRGSRRQFCAESLVRVMVFNRLADPRSKLGLLDWLGTVVMPDCPMPSHQQLLRAMDALIEQIDPVEAAVCEQIRPLLDGDLSVVFYDLTTVRYHGEEGSDDWPLITHGYSKDTGGTARQFVLGVVQSACGLPLLHTVAPGNVGEASTVESMLRQVLKRFAVKRLILVADRGLLTLETLAELARVGAETRVRVDFVMALSARRHAAMKQVNRTLVFQQGLAEGRFADHRLVVAHDETRATEQRAAREARMAAAEVVGERLAQKLDRQDAGENEPGRKATDRGAYARFKHELRERRLSHLYRIDWTAAQFTFDRDDDALAAAEAFDGRLYLLTSLDQKDYPAAAVVERYKTLAEIERGFRVMKSELLIAPMHHRLETRIRAHALICFLALLLHRVMRKRLKQRGSTTSPATALRVLEQLQQHQVRVGGATWAGLSRQSTEHHALFAQLDIPAPV